MTKLIVETDNTWTKQRIRSVITTETEFLRKIIQRTQHKLRAFERKYGPLNREALYGQVDDMELVEWEGERETLERLKTQLQSFEEITFEYK